MSYILDALNKSDQERQRERAPNLKTIHVSSKSGRSVNRWKVAIIALLVANLTLAGIWLQWWMQEDPATQVAVSQQAPRTISEPAASVEKIAPAETLVSDEARAAAVQLTAGSALTNVRPAVVPAVPFQPAQRIPEDVPDIHQLPLVIQEQIPHLTFASHIYASNPRSRMVSINGRSMREGDGISPDLILQQITPEGVILQFDNHLFRMSILRDWSFE